jgi:RNA-directed DNA polymerase
MFIVVIFMVPKNRSKSIALRWKASYLLEFANKWVNKLRIKKGAANENSYWWIFIYKAEQLIKVALEDFKFGTYKFNPMSSYTFKNTENQESETIVVWEYIDRLVIKLILKTITPIFKYIISASCYHLAGPSGVKTAIKQIKKALANKKFRYFLRADIKSYYASIDRDILAKQVEQNFKDKRLLKYLIDIINIPIIIDATIFTPNKGLPLRSSLSPFFGALYLTPLDLAFNKIKGVCYFRFMDDILILAETKRQYLRAKKRLQKILFKLKLSLSRQKTKMGRLEFGFHFLGVNFAVSRNQQNKIYTVISIHDRSCYRALDKITVMRGGAEYDAAKAQSYLSQWAMWWSKTIRDPNFGYFDCLRRWIQVTLNGKYYRDAKLGSGLFVT